LTLTTLTLQGLFEKIGKGETSYRRLHLGLRSRWGYYRLQTEDSQPQPSVELGTAIFSSESIALLRVDDLTMSEAWELYRERGEVDLSFTDCTSAVLARKHGITDIFTYDVDFRALGFVALSKIGPG
jgi:predicted nucleic acid-binding protein